MLDPSLQPAQPETIDTDMPGLTLVEMTGVDDDKKVLEFQNRQAGYIAEFDNTIYLSEEEVTTSRVAAGGKRYWIRHDGVDVGWEGYRLQGEDGTTAEIGVIVDKEAAGHGIGTAAISALTRHIQPQFEAVKAEVRADHKASLSVMEKAGFVKTTEKVEGNWVGPIGAVALRYEPAQEQSHGKLPIERLREQHLNNHGYAVERPTDEVIERLHQEDPRIEVIHGPDEVNGHDVLADYGAGPMTDEGWYSLYMADAIGDRLDQDFAGEDGLPIRAIQASLDGPVPAYGFTVDDLPAILQRGDITERDLVNFAGYKPGQKNDFRIHYRVMQYASITDFFREVEVGNTEGADRIFPVLLVYDRTMLRPGNGGVYGWQLPDSTEDRARVIRKAYVLDAGVRHRGKN
jgi:GNAT superfamily N-acetyltransferase